MVNFDEFVDMLEEGNLLTAGVKVIETVRYYTWRTIADDAIKTRLGERCIRRDAVDVESGDLRHDKSFMPLSGSIDSSSTL